MKRPFAIRRISLALAAPFLALWLAGSAVGADEEPEKSQTTYYPLKPSIVTNLSGGPKYIRCDIQLMTRSAMDVPQIELHSPALRHDILMLIGGQDGNQLKSRDGKEDLRKATLASVQERLKALTGKPIVDDLYFTAYYVK